MKILSVFVLFLLLFFAGLAIYFNDFIYQSSYPASTWPILIGLLTIAGFFLGLTSHFLSSKASSLLPRVLFGVVFTGFLFWTVTIAEDTLTKNLWKKNNSPELFASLKDHAGVHAGRTLLHWWNKSVLPQQVGNIQEFHIRTEFRIRHFLYLEKNNLLGCEGMDPIDCRVKWMTSFADHGRWDYDTRLFFYQDVWGLWNESSKLESLLGYVLKDQELEAGKLSLLKLLKLDEEFADRFLLIQQEDELKNLKLTARVFQEAGLMMQKYGGAPTPNTIKVKDLYAEAKDRLAKIPELEKDVARLRSGRGSPEESPAH